PVGNEQLRREGARLLDGQLGRLLAVPPGKAPAPEERVQEPPAEPPVARVLAGRRLEEPGDDLFDLFPPAVLVPEPFEPAQAPVGPDLVRIQVPAGFRPRSLARLQDPADRLY